MSEWRFHAARLNGDGTETFLERDLPVLQPKLLDQLSGPGGFTGVIAPQIARLRKAGRPIFEPWSTVIYAEANGLIRGGNLFHRFNEHGQELQLDCAGFTTYLVGEPYTGEWNRTTVDPLTIAREMWAHVQGKANADIGLRIDQGTKTPVRLGTDVEESRSTNGKTGKTTVTKKLKPYTMAWFETFDLGREFDQLAKETPFAYRVEHKWMGDDVVDHFLRFGYPSLGRRLHDLRFAVGENVTVLPDLEADAEDYASEVIVVGAGEGRKKVRSNPARNKTARLHKAKIIADSSLKSKSAADKAARLAAARLSGTVDLLSLEVMDHPHAPVGSYQVGDEILVQTADGWTDSLQVWVKVLEIENDPVERVSRLEVVRSEKA